MGQDKKRPNKRKIITIVLIGVIAIIAILGAVLFLRLNKLKDKLAEGEAYLEASKYDEAIISYEEALQIFPGSADAYLGLVKSYIDKGELDEAIRVLQSGIEKTGSKNLEASKELVYDQVFATYVMNHYVLNLLAGEQVQFTVTPKSRDMGFDIRFSSSDESVASVTEDGLVTAIADGNAVISANIGNETWGYRDIDCRLIVGVMVTYLEEAGCDYVTGTSQLTAPSYVFQADDKGEPLDTGSLEIAQHDASYRIESCSVSDPDAEGNVTYTVTTQTVLITEFGILPDSREASNRWYYDWKAADMFLADEYTGLVFRLQDLFGYDYPIIDSQVIYEGEEYHISGNVEETWVNDEEWEISFDEDTEITVAEAPVIGDFTYTVTVPSQYQGLVLILDKKGVSQYSKNDTLELKDTYFFDPLGDGSIRKAEDFYVIRLADIAVR